MRPRTQEPPEGHYVALLNPLRLATMFEVIGRANRGNEYQDTVGWQAS